MSSSIENQYGRIAYQFNPDTSIEGAPVEGLVPIGRPYTNPFRREVHTLVFAGTPSDGDYRITIAADDGTSLTITTTRTSGSPATSALVAAAWRTALRASPNRKGLIDSAEISSATITLTYKHRREYRITTSAPGSATLTWARVTAWSGSSLPVGRFVTLSVLEDDELSPVLPGNSASADDIAGMIVRSSHLGNPRGYNTQPGAMPEYPAGSVVSVVHEVILGLTNYGSVAASAGGAVHVVCNTAGGQARGVARANADGSNTVTLSAAKARWLEATDPGARGPVLVRM